MQIRLESKAPLGVGRQLKRQLRALIRSGELAPGGKLPSAQDLAALLRINRNTVGAVYRELVAEGLLEARVGAGTFVREGVKTVDYEALTKIFDRAWAEARAQGFEPEAISDTFVGRAVTRTHPLAGRRLLVVECHQETMEIIARKLEDELNVETFGVLIQDLEGSPELVRKSLAGVDLVVTGMNHLEELQAILPPGGPETVGLFLVSMARLISRLAELKPGTRVGVSCVDRRAASSLGRSVEFAGGKRLNYLTAGVNEPELLREMLAECDIVFASDYACPGVNELAGPDLEIVSVPIRVDPAGIDLVRERLQQKMEGER